MIYPIGLADRGAAFAIIAAPQPERLDPFCGAASARLRPGRVGFGSESGHSPRREDMEYPAGSPVLIAKRRGEGIP